MSVKDVVRVDCSCPYDVVIGRGLFKDIAGLVGSASSARRFFIVADERLKTYADEVVNSLKVAYGLQNTTVFTLEASEKNKRADAYLRVLEEMANVGISRGDALVALGGGVIGDVAGFAAATYMRGIDWICLPTTLLAMIDSSIGGKTGVDLPQGKNLVGIFHQPKLVVADLDALKTLPENEWKNGMGEAVKYSCLEGRSIPDLLLDGDVSDVVVACARYKADIVAADERDSSGRRVLLNFGHTIAHALERASNYMIPHGLAVAKGVAVMARAAFVAGEMSDAEYAKVCRVIESAGFSCDVDLDIPSLMPFVRMDKKATHDGVVVVKFRGMGDPIVERMSFDAFEGYASGKGEESAR